MFQFINKDARKTGMMPAMAGIALAGAVLLNAWTAASAQQTQDAAGQTAATGETTAAAPSATTAKAAATATVPAASFPIQESAATEPKNDAPAKQPAAQDATTPATAPVKKATVTRLKPLQKTQDAVAAANPGAGAPSAAKASAITTGSITKTPAPAVAGKATPSGGRCTRLAFLVNDYGKDGPTKDAQALLDKHIATWAQQKGIKTYKVGKKTVSCELFLDFVVFDEHTCRAEAPVCW